MNNSANNQKKDVKKDTEEKKEQKSDKATKDKTKQETPKKNKDIYVEKNNKNSRIGLVIGRRLHVLINCVKARVRRLRVKRLNQVKT